MKPPKNILVRLESLNKVLISTHAKPDGDALGSVLGLARILKANGKQAGIVRPDSLPRRYEPFVEAGDLLEAIDEKEWDALVVLDCGDISRVEDGAGKVAAAMAVINIDHHHSNTEFGEINWVDSKCSSTGEMIYRLAREAGWKISPPAAEALWVALVTDTGRFSYENTTPEVLNVAAELVAMGVPVSKINHTIYESVTLKGQRLRARAMASLEVCEDGAVALVRLGREDFEATGCGTEETEDIVNIPRSIEGAKIALLLYELPEEESKTSTKASFRTVEPYDAALICRTLGGGGHQRAAGCSVEGRLTEARETVLDLIHEMWFSGDK
jgi:phosphoesterase RecJ-like protein